MGQKFSVHSTCSVLLRMQSGDEQARRQNLAAWGGQKPEGGAKNQNGGATFLKYSIGYMQQPVDQK